MIIFLVIYRYSLTIMASNYVFLFLMLKNTYNQISVNNTEIKFMTWNTTKINSCTRVHTHPHTYT